MIAMTAAFAAAGVAQVYLERIAGYEFMTVATEIQPHFFVLILAATLFTVGIVLFIVNFYKFGIPTEQALQTEEQFEALKTA